MIFVFAGMIFAFLFVKAPSSKRNEAESSIVIAALVSFIIAPLSDICPFNGCEWRDAIRIKERFPWLLPWRSNFFYLCTISTSLVDFIIRSGGFSFALLPHLGKPSIQIYGTERIKEFLGLALQRPYATVLPIPGRHAHCTRVMSGSRMRWVSAQGQPILMRILRYNGMETLDTAQKLCVWKRCQSR